MIKDIKKITTTMKYIKHYVESIDTEFEIPSFDSSNFDTEHDFSEKYNDDVCYFLFCSLKKAINEGYDSIPVFSIDDTVFIMEKSTYKEKIDYCKKIFIESEEYEKCEELVNLEKKLKEFNE